MFAINFYCFFQSGFVGINIICKFVEYHFYTSNRRKLFVKKTWQTDAYIYGQRTEIQAYYVEAIRYAKLSESGNRRSMCAK